MTRSLRLSRSGQQLETGHAVAQPGAHLVQLVDGLAGLLERIHRLLRGLAQLGQCHVDLFGTARLGWSRTRIGQEIEANVDLAPFVPGRDSMGDIDIGGIPRFGPQSSAGVQVGQDVWSFAGDVSHSRGRHLIKTGLLVERYRDQLFNPTFSLGIYTFPSLQTFLRNTPQRFIGRIVPGSGVRFNGAFQAGQGINEDLQDGAAFKISPRVGFGACDLRTARGELWA